jgi:hypothetical protein
MKANRLTTLLLPVAALAAFGLLPACSAKEETASRAGAGGEHSAAAAAPQPIARTSSQPDDQGMIAFQGNIFVAASGLIDQSWQNAGWQIGKQPLDTDAGEAPADCILYPHLGVENQWVGRCKGSILVPAAGAAHIAVMITGSDGETTMVQVAPTPASP